MLVEPALEADLAPTTEAGLSSMNEPCSFAVVSDPWRGVTRLPAADSEIEGRRIILLVFPREIPRKGVRCEVMRLDD